LQPTLVPTVQLVAQPLPLHAKLPQLIVESEQEPFWHMRSVRVPLLQVDASHVVPSAALQPPLPSQFAWIQPDTLAVQTS
jgi:hypothetical protein